MCNADANSIWTILMLKSISQGFNDMLPSPLIIMSRADRVYMIPVRKHEKPYNMLKKTYLSTLTMLCLGQFELYIGGRCRGVDNGDFSEI